MPRDKKERALVLNGLANETRTIIIYEAPHHLVKTLEELESVLGSDRKLTICRELTKRYEEKMQTTLSDSLRYLSLIHIWFYCLPRYSRRNVTIFFGLFRSKTGRVVSA